MSTRASMTTAKHVHFWLLSILKLYAEEKILNDAVDLLFGVPGESDIAKFKKFWRWIVESAQDNAAAVDPQESEMVRSEMAKEACEAAMERGFFGIHDRKWWVNEIGRLVLLKAESSRVKKKPQQQHERERKEGHKIEGCDDERQHDDPAGDAAIGREIQDASKEAEQNMSVPDNLIEDLTDEGIEDISSDEELYGKNARVLRLKYQRSDRDDSVLNVGE